MFQSARLRLTIWYVVIMLSLSVLVSAFVYAAINEELQRIDYLQQSIEVNGRLPASVTLPRGPMRVNIMPLDTTQIRLRILSLMLMINLGLAVLVGVLSYFLAGKTLQPIREMVDAQKRFIADASHELRTPITSLKTATEVTLRDKDITLPQAKQLIRENLDEINHLQELSDKLLRLSSWETLSQSAEKTAVSLNTILLAAKKKVLTLAKKKNISLKLQKTTSSVWGNAASLTELFVIILDNAIKYSPADSAVSVTTEAQKHQVRIKVADKGVGISQKEQSRIFNRFYQTDHSRTNKNGYGLGLAIAEKIIDEHSGSITVSSSPGKGSTFTVTLPVSTHAVTR